MIQLALHPLAQSEAVQLDRRGEVGRVSSLTTSVDH
jgi:hypothetical protein